MSVEAVRQNLTARGIYPSFLIWYNYYFGVNGQAVQYFSIVNSTAGNTTASFDINTLAMTTLANGTIVVAQVNIPPQLMNIVSWVLQLVGSQVKTTCGSCLSQ